MRFLVGLILVGNWLSAFSQSFPQWGQLRPGPYAIGYQTIRTVDYTRTYFTPGRPLQIYVWYPAAVKSSATYMRFGDYLADAAYDWGDAPQQTAYLSQYFRKGFMSGALNPSFPGTLTDSQFKNILNTAVPVVRKVAPAAGKFPVLLHAHVSGALHQSLMMEYLASHGYVVLSISRYNSSPAFYGRGEDGTTALLQLTEDTAFMLAQARNLPYADTDKAAMIGMSAEAGLSLQLKEMPLKAIACLDCLWLWDPKSITQLPYYDPRKIRIPLLELANTAMEGPPALLDSLPFAERYIGRFREYTHADFYPFPKIVDPTQAGKHRNYDFGLISLLQFLNAVLKNDTAGKAFLTGSTQPDGFPEGFLRIRKEPAQLAIPTENELLTWLRYGQMEKVRETWKIGANSQQSLISEGAFFFTTLLLIRDNELQADEALTLYLSAFPPQTDRVFNLFGYSFLHAKQASRALAMFEQAAKQAPQSPYAYEGLADAFLALGDKVKAESHARKTLQLLDTTQLSPTEKGALRKNAEEKIIR